MNGPFLRPVLALLSVLGLTGGAKSATLTVFNLTPPLRLIASNTYSDGGTLNFVVVDAKGRTFHGGFKAGLKLSESSCPLHCFVGGDYPTEPGVRLLPLWGAEERKLVQLFGTVISDAASAGGEYGLIATVEKRRRTLEAIDHGLLVDHETASHFFNGADTAHVQSLVADWATNSYVVTFRDAEGKEIRVGYPATPDSAMNPATLLGPWCVAGSLEDRMMMTLITTALGNGKDGGPSAVNERDRSALLKVLKVRTAKILEADKHCTQLNSGIRHKQ